MIVERHVCTFQALGGTNEVQLFASSEAEARRVFEEVVQEVRRIEVTFSRFRADSIVSRINAAAGGEALEVDSETNMLLQVADTLFRISGGLFDITSGALQRVWNFRSPELPTQAAIDAALALVGWQRVEWASGRVRLPVVGMQIDFGGFGKEYAVDRAAAVCLAAGMRSGLVNFGGDVRILGPRPDGSPWRVGIRHPRLRGQVLRQCQLSSGALATSGDYERFKEVDGLRYCHIIHPKTGAPVRELQSVSVFAESCLVAGALSTIAMLSGKVEAAHLLRARGFSGLLVDALGVVEAVEPTRLELPFADGAAEDMHFLLSVG